jgi:hypothetical protein
MVLRTPPRLDLAHVPTIERSPHSISNRDNSGLSRTFLFFRGRLQHAVHDSVLDDDQVHAKRRGSTDVESVRAVAVCRNARDFFLHRRLVVLLDQRHATSASWNYVGHKLYGTSILLSCARRCQCPSVIIDFHFGFRLRFAANTQQQSPPGSVSIFVTGAVTYNRTLSSMSDRSERQFDVVYATKNGQMLIEVSVPPNVFVAVAMRADTYSECPDTLDGVDMMNTPEME